MLFSKNKNEIRTSIDHSMPRAAAKPGQSTQSKTINPKPAIEDDGVVKIGKGTRVSGLIDDCCVLDVYGVVEADVNAETLIVREGGGILGTIHADNAKIFGIIEGSFTVHEHLEISETGDVSGVISYGTLTVAKGAKLRGDLQTGDALADTKVSETAAASSGSDYPYARRDEFRSSLEGNPTPSTPAEIHANTNGATAPPKYDKSIVVRH
jgi:cytoskeletal protein CcmA (bactofilin family)